MDDPGQKLKKRREELDLRYRDVVEASGKIAERRKSDEYRFVLSRLSEVENQQALPSIYKLYTLVPFTALTCWRCSNGTASTFLYCQVIRL